MVIADDSTDPEISLTKVNLSVVGIYQVTIPEVLINLDVNPLFVSRVSSPRTYLETSQKKKSRMEKSNTLGSKARSVGVEWGVRPTGIHGFMNFYF